MYDLKIRPLRHFDVAVVGGGVAGVAAAVSAARGGASFQKRYSNSKE